MALNENKKNKKTTKLVQGNWTNSFSVELFFIYFKPSNYVSSLTEVNFNTLREQGIKLIICDLDNTLVPHFTKFPTARAKEIIKNIQKAGLEVILISNNTEKRVENFANILKVDYISNAKKPFTKKIRNFLKTKNYENKEILMIGDMVVMDIVAANRLKVDSILVRPILTYSKDVSKLMNWVEDKFLKRLQRNNFLLEEDYLSINLYDDEYKIF